MSIGFLFGGQRCAAHALEGAIFGPFDAHHFG